MVNEGSKLLEEQDQKNGGDSFGMLAQPILPYAIVNSSKYLSITDNLLSPFSFYLPNLLIFVLFLKAEMTI